MSSNVPCSAESATRPPCQSSRLTSLASVWGKEVLEWVMRRRNPAVALSTGAATLTAAALVSLTACGGDSGNDGLVVPPRIVNEPASASVIICTGAKFEVAATGSSPLSYQWLKDGIAISGATTASYSIPRAGLGDAGVSYSVVVSNQAGSATSQPAVLSVTDPGGAIALAQDQAPNSVAVNGTTIFFTSARGVRAASLDCSGAVQSLYDVGALFGATESPSGIVLGSGSVVWADGNVGGIGSVPIDGGQPSLLATLGGPGPYEVALAGEQLYWAHLAGGVQSMAVGGGAVTTYPASVALGGSEDDGIAVDELYVYWNDLLQKTVNKMPLGGGPVTVLASNQGYLVGIATDGHFVYWASTTGLYTDSETGSISRVSRDGGVVELLASQATETLNLGLDGSYVYWTASGHTAGSGSLSKVPIDGSQPPNVLIAGLDFPFGIAVDSQHVYWTEASRVVRLEK